MTVWNYEKNEQSSKLSRCGRPVKKNIQQLRILSYGKGLRTTLLLLSLHDPSPLTEIEIRHDL